MQGVTGRIVKLALEVVGVLVAGAVIAVLALAWRLTTGPISLDFARGLLQEALTPGDLPIDVAIGEPVLTWKGWGRVFDVTVKDVRLQAKDGGFSAEVPSVFVRLSARALTEGMAAPIRISMNRPNIRVSRVSARLRDVAAFDAEWLSSTLAPLAASHGEGERLSYLRLVELSRGRLEIPGPAETGVVVLEDLDASFSRSDGGLRIDATTIAAIDGATPRLAVELDYNTRRDRITGSTAFSGLPVALLANAWPAVAENVSISTPTTGSLSFELAPPGAVLKASGTIEATRGEIHLPRLYPGPLPFDTLALDADYDAAAATIDVTRFQVRDGESTASATVRIADIFDTATLRLRGGVTNVPGGRLDEVWPPVLGVHARRWAVANIEGGMVPSATVELDASFDPSDPKSFVVTRLDGGIDFTGATAHYFKPLPPVTGVNGRAEFDTKRFDIAITGGRLDDITVAGSTVNFFDIDTDVEKARIQVVAQGSVPTALGVLGHESLRLAQKVGFDPGSVQGQAGARVEFAFLLKRNLTLNEVQFAASANLRGVGMPNVILDQALSGGTMTLDLNRDGMRIAGEGEIAGHRVSITQDEVFAEGAKIRRRKQLKTVVEGRVLADLGLPDLASLGGPVTIDAEMLDLSASRSEINAVLDLRDARAAIRPLRWAKPEGAAGRVRLSIAMQGDQPLRLSSASLIAADLGVDLSADFARRTGALERITIDRLVLADSEMTGTVELRADGHYHATLSGQRLDIRRFMEGTAEENPVAGPPFSVNARFDELVFSTLPAITETLIDIRHDGARLSDIQLAGRVNGEPVTVDYLAQDDIRRFEFRADDAGRVLNGFDIIDSMKGGRLTIAGTITGQGADERTLVNLSVDEFGLIDAPVLAQILNAAFLVGLVDTLQGNGIQFQRLNAEIAISDDQVEILDALAYGASLGVSATGILDRANSTASINGMIVPAYGLSRLIDQIPILGRVLTGGEKEGLLAAEYLIGGGLDRPTVTVNPLTAFTPGFLRALVKATGAPATTPPEEPAPQEGPG